MRAKIKVKGKEIVIDNITRASGIKKYTGLMFKPQETNALLFELGRGRKAIHSLFCPNFLAVWLLEGKIQETRIIEPWKFSIKPEKEFDKLLEIPVNSNYLKVIEALNLEGVTIL